MTVTECVSPLNAKYARTDMWARGDGFPPMVCFYDLFSLLWALKVFALVSRSLVQCTWGSAHLFFFRFSFFFFFLSFRTADGGAPSGRGQECSLGKPMGFE